MKTKRTPHFLHNVHASLLCVLCQDQHSVTKIDAHLRHLTPVTPVKRGASGKQYTHQSRSSLTLTCLLCPASLSSPLLLGLNPSLFCPASARVQSQGLPDYPLLSPCAPRVNPQCQPRCQIFVKLHSWQWQPVDELAAVGPLEFRNTPSGSWQPGYGISTLLPCSS